MSIRRLILVVLIALSVSAYPAAQAKSIDGAIRVPVVITGGHDTAPRDRGRPVDLVAGALGVPPEVFREAFSHVHPAPAGMRPTQSEVRANKDALLDALGRYGVTNDRLDEVSNYYRYVRSRGEMWPTTEATAYALVKHGVVVAYVVTNGGSGYSSPPEISVPSVPGATGTAHLTFSSDFDRNGSISSIKP